VHRHQRPLRHHSRLRDRHRGRDPRRVQPRRGEDRRTQQDGKHGPGPLRGPGEAQRLRMRRLRDSPRRPGIPEPAAVAAEHPAQARHRRGLDPHRLHLQGQEGLLHPRRGPLLHQPPAGGRHAGPQRRRARPQRMPGTARTPTGELPRDRPHPLGTICDPQGRHQRATARSTIARWATGRFSTYPTTQTSSPSPT